MTSLFLNIRVGIRVRGFHLVFFHMFSIFFRQVFAHFCGSWICPGHGPVRTRSIRSVPAGWSKCGGRVWFQFISWWNIYIYIWIYICIYIYMKFIDIDIVESVFFIVPIFGANLSHVSAGKKVLPGWAKKKFETVSIWVSHNKMKKLLLAPKR